MTRNRARNVPDGGYGQVQQFQAVTAQSLTESHRWELNPRPLIQTPGSAGGETRLVTGRTAGKHDRPIGAGGEKQPRKCAWNVPGGAA